MNERLKELYSRAALHAFNQRFIPLTTGPRDLQEVITEKFAELIVNECIDQIITGPNGPAYYAVEAAVRVKKHFGVEE
jgi:hypothetical protein